LPNYAAPTECWTAPKFQHRPLPLLGADADLLHVDDCNPMLHFSWSSYYSRAPACAVTRPKFVDITYRSPEGSGSKCLFWFLNCCPRGSSSLEAHLSMPTDHTEDATSRKTARWNPKSMMQAETHSVVSKTQIWIWMWHGDKIEYNLNTMKNWAFYIFTIFNV